MKRVLFFLLSSVICTAAMAKPAYIFQDGVWDAGENNDLNHPLTHQPYTEKQVREFLESKKDSSRTADIGSRALALCGVVEIKKGCHQANDRHITIFIDPRDNKNKVKNCVALNAETVHVNGC